MSLPDLICACATARRASRLLTRLYDQHLREYGLEATQYALLTAIEGAPGRSQVALAGALGLEKATLSRNLGLMERKGWISVKPGASLTDAGKKLLAEAYPAWAKAQADLQESIGKEDWAVMCHGMRALTDAADRALAG